MLKLDFFNSTLFTVNSVKSQEVIIFLSWISCLHSAEWLKRDICKVAIAMLSCLGFSQDDTISGKVTKVDPLKIGRSKGLLIKYE